MKIINYRPLTDKPNILGEFDLLIEERGLTLFKLKAIRGKNGVFAAAPSYMTEVAGQKKFYPYFQFDKDSQKIFNQKLNDLLKEFVHE